MGTGLAIASLAVAVVGTGASIHQSREAAQESKKAEKAQQRMADMKAAREKRNQLAERRRLSAAAEAQGVATGGQDSSAEAGAIASIGAQTASNVGGLGAAQAQAKKASKARQRGADHSSNALAAGAVGSFASDLFDPKDLFKGK
jgi:hypothetical protein